MKSALDRDWTVADLDQFPDGATRYEIFDGELVVTPPPSDLHQLRAIDLAMVLRDASPPDLLVFAAPIGVSIGERRHFEPDVTVRSRAGFRDDTAVPVLVVEVLSPGTWSNDVRRKRDVYAQTFVPSCCLLDPVMPAVTILELENGEYVERGVVGPGEELTVARPFEVRLAPAEWTSLDSGHAEVPDRAVQ